MRWKNKRSVQKYWKIRRYHWSDRFHSKFIFILFRRKSEQLVIELKNSVFGPFWSKCIDRNQLLIRFCNLNKIYHNIFWLWNTMLNNCVKIFLKKCWKNANIFWKIQIKFRIDIFTKWPKYSCHYQWMGRHPMKTLIVWLCPAILCRSNQTAIRLYKMSK